MSGWSMLSATKAKRFIFVNRTLEEFEFKTKTSEIK